MDEKYSGADRAQSHTYNSNDETDARSEAEREDEESRGYLEDRQNHEAWAKKLKLSFSDLAVFTKHGYYYDKVPTEDTPSRRQMLAYLKRSEIPPPKWMMLSGLYPQFRYTEAERRIRLRALYKALVLLIRRALARRDVDGFKNERSIYWDPVAEVCRDLELAQSKLSSFCKEFSGHSLSQVVDCIRVEGLGRKLRAGVKGFLGARGATSGTETALTKTPRSQRSHKGKEEEKWVVWQGLKAGRKWPEFSRDTWAMGFGFSTYRRMYRACIAVYGKTPHQLEMEMIEEMIKDVGEEKIEDVFKVMTLEEIEGLVRGIGAFVEDWFGEKGG